MLDVAREQSLRPDHLRQFAQLSAECGYDALGLYLEHRYAYDCAPWANGDGCLTAADIRILQEEFPRLQIIPFINLLGHFEGFIYTEEGKIFREELFKGLQACPCAPGFRELCEKMVDETIATFDSPIIHFGGDETAQLGLCPRCAALASENGPDGKAWLYGQHFGHLAQRVIKRGRQPAIWGDMFADHPSALESLPKTTLIFDWKYQSGIAQSAAKFRDAGLDVIGCPAVHVYNAAWCHLRETDQNVRQVSQDVQELDLAGVCVTTWESGLFGAYDTLFPAIRGARQIIDDPISAPEILACYSGDQHEWARLMSHDLADLGGVFAFSGIRSSLKARLLLYRNPFLAWMHHGDELSGERGEQALELLQRALLVAPGEAEKGVTIFVRSAVEFIQLAEKARLAYAEGKTDTAILHLALTREIFDHLEGVARRSLERIGGSRADVERCRAAKRHVETVINNLRQYGQRELGYLPAFEVITNPRFMPHDQGCWWLINRWANE